MHKGQDGLVPVLSEGTLNPLALLFGDAQPRAGAGILALLHRLDEVLVIQVILVFCFETLPVGSINQQQRRLSQLYGPAKQVAPR